MKFKKDDENYIYQVIGKNIKKYRKLKGWTQERLAEEIDYSLSFISGIESTEYHQTFSLGALWRISRVLGVDFSKLCEDTDNTKKVKFIIYKCDTCGIETKMPIQVVKHFKNIYELTGNKSIPTFDCTNCDGQLKPINPMDL